MGLHDRQYWREDFDQGERGSGGPRFRGILGGMPKPTSMVKWLLIANIVVFVLQLTPEHVVEKAFAVIPSAWWQLWRYATFQFLHGGLLHLLFNMLGLYFLGMILEGAWGAKRFLVFYLSCGAFAGLCHVVMTFAFDPTHIERTLVGASGGVFAIVLVCAVLFPQIRLIFFLFPLPIRFVAALFIGLAVYNLLSGIARGGFVGVISDAAHLGGAAAGAFWIWVLPRFRKSFTNARTKRSSGAWQRKLLKQADEQAEIDRILYKIHEQGIASLTAGEKRTLKNATRQQQRDEHDLYKL